VALRIICFGLDDCGNSSLVGEPIRSGWVDPQIRLVSFTDIHLYHLIVSPS